MSNGGQDAMMGDPGRVADRVVAVLDVTPDYTTNTQGQAWYPERKMIVDAKLGPILELICDMHALVGNSQRRIVTVSGRVLLAQGSAYRASSGTRIVPLVLS